MGNCWTFQSNPKYFLDAVLGAHNMYRAHHGSPPLVLDKQRCKQASMHANLCAYHNRVIAFIGGTKGSFNIHRSQVKELSEISPVKAVNDWYSELRFHKFVDSYTKNSKSHEFARLLWKSGVKLGVGFARTTQKNVSARVNYLVCLYDEIDETKGPENVFRPFNNLPCFKIQENAFKPTEEFKFSFLSNFAASWGIQKEFVGQPEWKVYFDNDPKAREAINHYFANLTRARKLAGHLLELEGRSIGDENHKSRRKRDIAFDDWTGDRDQHQDQYLRRETETFLETKTQSSDYGINTNLADKARFPVQVQNSNRIRRQTNTPIPFKHQRYYHNP